MRKRLGAYLSAVGFAMGFSCPQGMTQSYPIELETCGATCREAQVAALLLDCDFQISINGISGRAMYGPLIYWGPIRISVNARPMDPIPLRIEYRRTINADCEFRPGIGAWQTFGTTSCEPESLWVRSPFMDLVLLEPGDTYWIQLVGEIRQVPEDPDSQLRFSTTANCVRVESQNSPIAAGTWGRVKSLYR
jgi:hypothetical protein